MEDGTVVKDDGTSGHEAKQQRLRGKDEEAVTVETTSQDTVPSDDVRLKNSDDDDDDDESDEIEDGELVSSSSSESELEPEEAVEEKGKASSLQHFVGNVFC